MKKTLVSTLLLFFSYDAFADDSFLDDATKVYAEKAFNTASDKILKYISSNENECNKYFDIKGLKKPFIIPDTLRFGGYDMIRTYYTLQTVQISKYGLEKIVSKCGGYIHEVEGQAIKIALNESEIEWLQKLKDEQEK